MQRKQPDMMVKRLCRKLLPLIAVWCAACNSNKDPNHEMTTLLASVAETEFNSANGFAPAAVLVQMDSFLRVSGSTNEQSGYLVNKARMYLQLGREDSSQAILETLMRNEVLSLYTDPAAVQKDLALTYLRMGEKANCRNNHSAESCIFPIKGGGVHRDKWGSVKAAELYRGILQRNPADLETKWLLNIAYMTMGSYPQCVPTAYLIPGLDQDTSSLVKPFSDAAIRTGLNTEDMAGGSIVDDFNGDGYLDIITSGWDLASPMHYFVSNKKGGFEDRSEPSGLSKLTGGLNLLQTDYNNDGLKDIFVLRGGWKGKFGREPNSLLRNNGDGSFTDVTKAAGLLSFHPTQTATWNDFNGDGWLDVFIGNESTDAADDNICELYINNGKGGFKNMAVESGANIKSFVKGVTSGDYNNDGKSDIFISTLHNKKVLLKNEGVKNGVVRFTDVTKAAGLETCTAKTFGTWFWDYNNDGWLDLFVCNYDFNSTLGVYAAAEALGLPTGNAGKQFLYRNNGNGTFSDVSKESGMAKVAFAMGSNFGDIDNDGYLDIYLGTGNPNYESLVPNKMFKNLGGKHFADITAAARVGNLQKGHGVSFADLDNDGDEDIHIEVGGAYQGDAYQNSLYLNPGQNNNHWINISLEGVNGNKAAIGAKIKVTFSENGVQRSVYRDVNSGGSFGASPLRQHIGIGSANRIESIEIKWPVSNKVQVFKDVQPDNNIHIREGVSTFTIANLDPFDLSGKKGLISCGASL
ncbi:CRTAC1 family protein [Paracnuella aquatica]|nr:CRTAC1 family protein [Paracnuella aquatica]